MSAFDLDLNSENSLGDSNIQAFTSPKLSEKDLSAIYANSGERSFKLSSPIPMSGEYKLNCLGSCDRLNSLNDSSILQDSNTSSVQEETNDAPTASEETVQQRMEREERESQELAWQLMQEENMEVYNMQMQFMRENADQMSEEDLALIQAMINESAQPQQGAPAATGTIGADEEGEAEEGDELNESDSSNWDYERLLQLGQQIGDVKTERWRMRAKSVINSLPRQLYSELMPQQSAAAATTTKPVTVFSGAVLSSPVAEPTERDERSSSNKKQCVRAADGCCDAAAGTTSAAQAVQTERCVVCMDDFEAQEELVVFPCKHYFHIPCTEGWLADHNFCPSCKTKVSATPEK